MAVAEPPLLAAALCCDHCGLPVPQQSRRSAAGHAFCCAGCLVVWDILHDRGLGEFYRLGERRGAPVRPTATGFAEFDHPAFHALHVERRPDGASEGLFYLEGVHCRSCVWLVEHVPLLLDGTILAELDVARSMVRLVWDGERRRLSEIAVELDRLGYRLHPFRGRAREALRRVEDRAMLVRIGIAGAIAGNVMMLALAIYSGWFGGMENGVQRYLRWMSLLLTAPAVLGPGRVFFRGAWGALRARRLHMDVPIALAIVAGFARGAVNTWTDRGPIYFDGVAALIFLLLAGRFLLQRAQRIATGATDLLHSLAPATARVRAGNEIHVVPADALLPGMEVEVRPGESIPADGVVLEGRSAIDLGLLSGESRPVHVGPGERVFAGTVNRSSPLHVAVECCGEATRLARILGDVDRAAARRAPVVLQADRLAGWFVGIVLVLAAATWGYWFAQGDRAALDHAIALLIVTCPCALALATPLAFTVAIGRASHVGILVRGGDAFETLAGHGVLYLDKTGTVTEGRNTLVEWEGPVETCDLVLALEARSNHPIAAGFRDAWGMGSGMKAEAVTEVAGGGIEGRVGGRTVTVGSPAFVCARCDSTVPGRSSTTHSFEGAALSPVWIAIDGAVVSRAWFGDPLREGAREAIERLRRRGWRVRLLSGDDRSVVRSVGCRLGIAEDDCIAEMSPEAKLHEIERAASAGPTVMVGDGFNDAAAIAGATVGIGVKGGAQACLAVADIYLSRDGLDPLVELFEAAGHTMMALRRNLVFSLVYNLVGAGLAMTGRIDPLIAAILMPASSLTVILASWWGRPLRASPAAAPERAIHHARRVTEAHP